VILVQRQKPVLPKLAPPSMLLLNLNTSPRPHEGKETART